MLTTVEIRNAKPGSSARKLSDGGGLYLLLTPAGGKLWRLKYRVKGREKLLSIGSYPEIGPAQAREAREAARRLLALGIDPGEQRKAEREVERVKREHTFGAIAAQWFAKKSGEWSPATHDKARFYFDRDLLPALGSRPIADIRRPELVEVLHKIEARDALDVAKKCRGWIGNVFRYALACGAVEINHATDLHVVAAPARPRRAHPHLPVAELPTFLRALSGYRGERQTAIAIRLHLLTGARPGELRGAPWSEFDLDVEIWSIPAERMKMSRPHVVPLPVQAIALLRELHTLHASSPLAFPSRDRRDRPMSENTVNTAIARIGFGGRQTGHGFRHLVSTALNERGYNRDWIERQLSHGDENGIRGTYNDAQYLDQRRQMMQSWADEIDCMEAGGSVVAIRRHA
ncbi:MAG: tyrosine-type recombinase/integrase [Steroidobacteraceae bacterium]